MWVGPLNLFIATTGDVWIILSYWIWGYVLHVEHITCVIMNCGWLSYPSLFLNNSLASTGGKQYQKITIPIFTLALQNFAFSRLLSFYTLYHACYFSSISPVWVVIAVSKWLYVVVVVCLFPAQSYKHYKNKIWYITANSYAGGRQRSQWLIVLAAVNVSPGN